MVSDGGEGVRFDPARSPFALRPYSRCQLPEHEPPRPHAEPLGQGAGGEEGQAHPPALAAARPEPRLRHAGGASGAALGSGRAVPPSERQPVQLVGRLRLHRLVEPAVDRPRALRAAMCLVRKSLARCSLASSAGTSEATPSSSTSVASAFRSFGEVSPRALALEVRLVPTANSRRFSSDWPSSSA